MKGNTHSLSLRTISNQTLFELVTGFRRETGNQMRLLCALTAGLLIPVVLVFLAITFQNAASNLEDRRHITAFTENTTDVTLATLNRSLRENPLIARINVLPAGSNIPAILEIEPILSLTSEETKSLAQDLENSDEFNFVSINPQLLQRNTGGYHKAKMLSLVLFLIALATAALTSMSITKREIFRSNSANINLQRQLGATTTTISRPYIIRAAIMAGLAIVAAAGFVTVFYNALKHYVDISSYSSVLLNTLPVEHLIVLASVSVTAACFAAATALQSIFISLNQLLKNIQSKLKLTNHFIFARN